MEVIKIIEDWILTKKWFLWTYLFLLLSTGISYIVLQYVFNGEIKDSIFIGLLFGGTFILLIGVKWIYNFVVQNALNFINELKNVSRDNAKALFKNVFNNPLLYMVATGYGIAVGTAPFLFNIWDDIVYLKILLSVFLFVVNFLTGASLFSLYMLFVLLYKTSKNINVKIYDRTSITVKFVTELSKRASILASFYVAFSISSIYFSEFPMNTMTIGYSIFATLIILSAYIIPMIPIRNNIQIQKRELKNEISQLLQSEFDSILKNAKEENVINSEKYDSLLELKNKISNVTSFPVGIKTIWNGISIILITLLPILIQLVLESILN